MVDKDELDFMWDNANARSYKEAEMMQLMQKAALKQQYMKVCVIMAEEITALAAKYPNDTELGKEIRKFVSNYSPGTKYDIEDIELEKIIGWEKVKFGKNE